MAYIDRYVSALAVGAGNGSLASPWTMLQAIAGAQNGYRLNVKADGTYTLPMFSGGIGYCSLFGSPSHMGTHENPICWRGYSSTPGDNGVAKIMPASYGAGLHRPIVFGYGGEGDFVFPSYLYSNIFMNLEFEGAVTSPYGLCHAFNSVFQNCTFRNTATSGDQARAVNGISAHLFNCTIESLYKPVSGQSEAVCGSMALWGGKIKFGDYGVRNEPGMTAPAHYGHPVVSGVTLHGTAGSRAGIRAVRGQYTENNFYNSQYGVEVLYENHPDGRRIYILNNVFHTHNTAISVTSGENHGVIMARNKCYNCTFQFGGSHGHYWSGKEPFEITSALTTNPWTNPASGNFTVTVAGAPPLYKSGTTGKHAGASSIPEDYPSGWEVQQGVAYARSTGNARSGRLMVPGATDVRDGVVVGEFAGRLVVPVPGDVRSGTVYDSPGPKQQTGSLDLPAEADVRFGVDYDGATKTGQYAGAECPLPEPEDLREGITIGGVTGTLDLPQEKHVLTGVQYDNETKTGTYMPDACEPRDITFEDISRHAKNSLEDRE